MTTPPSLLPRAVRAQVRRLPQGVGVGCWLLRAAAVARFAQCGHQSPKRLQGLQLGR